MRRKTRGDKPSGPRQARTDAKFTVPVNELGLDDMNLGVSNIVRSYQTTDVGRTPSLIFREISIFNGFTDGFSASNDFDHGDAAPIATDVTETDATATIYPITPMAKEFITRIFPVLENVFQSGTGSRHTVSNGEIVRYMAMVIEAYSLILNILKINHLAYHYDWKEVFPYVGIPPSYIYRFALEHKCSDVDISQLWIPLMQKLERKVLFPSIVEEIKRQHMPMFPVNGATLFCPFHVPTNAETLRVDDKFGENIYTRVTQLLNYIDTVLNRADSTIRTFLPIVMVDMRPWEGFASPSHDQARWVAWTNNGGGAALGNNAFDDDKDPAIGTDIVGSFNEGDDLPPSFEWFTHDAQPLWGRVRMATIYELIHNTGDDVGVQLTSHGLREFVWFGDNSVWTNGISSQILYWGRDTSIGSATDAIEAVGLNLIPSIRRAHARLDTDNKGPLPEAGMVVANVPLDAVVKNQIYDTQRYFSYDALRQLELMAAGASLREVRATLLGVALRHA